MVKLLTLVSILLLTLKSFGQTDTKTLYNPNKDSVVTIPKQVAIWMLQDIVKADSYAEELKLLNSSLELKQSIINQQDTIIIIQKQKLRAKDSEISTYEELNLEQEVKIKGLERNVKKQTKAKKFWRIMAFVAPCIGGYLVHYSWKN
jgi:hypothetical protein